MMNKELQQISNLLSMSNKRSYAASHCSDLLCINKNGVGTLNHQLFKILIICFSFLFYTTLQAQPTINNNLLPKIGDTVILASDNLPEGVAIFPEKGHQDWDLSLIHI